MHRREVEKKKQEAVDREQELAATKIQSRIRGKQARREQCSEAGLSHLKPTCALYSVASRSAHRGLQILFLGGRGGF